jgi:ABC-type glutathione transport system ATPase component
LKGATLEPILKAENIVKKYRGAVFTGSREVAALAGVSLAIYPGATVALVGPSGCGKSTLALCLAGLERLSSGRIWFSGTELTALEEKQLRLVRPGLQLVFQDPAGSLNPRLNALELVTEPLNIQDYFDKAERYDRGRSLLARVGIPRDKYDQRLGEISGGQRQRIAIARALILQPKILILDEPLSALDCAVQARVANLLLELQASLGLTYLFVTHDLRMAAHLGDEIAVMEGGRIVEIGPTERIVDEAQHPLTRRLLATARRSRKVAGAPLVV